MQAVISIHGFHQRLRRQFKASTAIVLDFFAYVVIRMLVAVIQTLPYDMGDCVCRFLARLASGSNTACLISCRGENLDRSRLPGQLPVHRPHSMQ